MVEVIVPELGESIREGTILRWLKQQGDEVQEGEILLELETDKVNLEIIAETAGVLQGVHKQEGDTVAVGEVLANIEAIDGQVRAATDDHKSAPDSGARTGSRIEPVQPPSESHPPAAAKSDAPHATEDRPLRPTPSMRRMARSAEGEPERQPAAPTASAAASAPSEPQQHPAAPADGHRDSAATEPGRSDEKSVRMTRRRLTIARRLVEAQHTAAMLTTFNEVDMTAILDIRKRRRDRFREEHGIGLGFMSFFTKAVVSALRSFPALNAEIRGEDMILKQHYDIGIAVSTDKGLVVPVLREADRLSFAAIEGEIARLAQRARDDSLTLAELQGGTFTITNGGVFGSLLSTPILNAPQVGILGMHKIQERPIAVNGQVLIHPMMYLALSYDHRIVDGSEAVRFLVRVKELAEDPESLLLEG